MRPREPRGRNRRFPFGYRKLHADPNIEYQLNRFLGADPEADVRALASRIHDYADWKRELLAAGARHEAVAEFAAAARHYRAAEFFLTPGDPDKRRAYDRFSSLFWRHHEGERLERASVQYEGASLPALVLRAPQPRDTVVIHAGFDAFIAEMFGIGEAIRDAGFDVVLFDGPGQGAALVEQGLTMTHEWERPVAAVLDHFRLRDVTLVGISLGGYLAPRAAAFEPRVQRVVAFDVMYDFFDAVISHGGPLLSLTARTLLSTRASKSLLDSAVYRLMERDLNADWGVRQGMHVTGTKSPSEFLDALCRYNLRGISPRIRQDFLLLAGAEDHHVPVRQFHEQAAALTGVRSLTARIFTASEEAGSHCQYGNLDLAVSTIVAWIHERLDSIPGR